MIKAVTYQSCVEFNSNLYAMEVKSRFIDQTKASGYYKGYGKELNAKTLGSIVIIESGLLCVNGRMSEIVGEENISIKLTNGMVGFVVAHSETYHPEDNDNCKFVAYTAYTLDSINLQQEDTTSRESESVNKVYELPLYSFSIENGAITNLQKLIEPIADYEKLKGLVDKTIKTANEALDTSNLAKEKSELASEASNNAVIAATNATDIAIAAKTNAEKSAVNAEQAATECLEALNKAIEKGGTVIEVNGEIQSKYDATDVMKSDDTFVFDGGGA